MKSPRRSQWYHSHSLLEDWKEIQRQTSALISMSDKTTSFSYSPGRTSSELIRTSSCGKKEKRRLEKYSTTILRRINFDRKLWKTKKRPENSTERLGFSRFRCRVRGPFPKICHSFSLSHWSILLRDQLRPRNLNQPISLFLTRSVRVQMRSEDVCDVR